MPKLALRCNRVKSEVLRALQQRNITKNHVILLQDKKDMQAATVKGR